MADLPPPSAAALPPDDGGDDGSPPPPSPDGDGPPPLPGPPRQISEEDLDTLGAMGFERPQCELALTFARGNVEGALQILLNPEIMELFTAGLMGGDGRRRGGSRGRLGAARAMAEAGAPPPPGPPPGTPRDVEVTPAAMAALMEMGYPPVRCSKSLFQTGGDVERAAMFMLEHGDEPDEFWIFSPDDLAWAIETRQAGLEHQLEMLCSRPELLLAGSGQVQVSLLQLLQVRPVSAAHPWACRAINAFGDRDILFRSNVRRVLMDCLGVDNDPEMALSSDSLDNAVVSTLQRIFLDPDFRPGPRDHVMMVEKLLSLVGNFCTAHPRSKLPAACETAMEFCKSLLEKTDTAVLRDYPRQTNSIVDAVGAMLCQEDGGSMVRLGALECLGSIVSAQDWSREGENMLHRLVTCRRKRLPKLLLRLLLERPNVSSKTDDDVYGLTCAILSAFCISSPRVLTELCETLPAGQLGAARSVSPVNPRLEDAAGGGDVEPEPEPEQAPEVQAAPATRERADSLDDVDLEDLEFIDWAGGGILGTVVLALRNGCGDDLCGLVEALVTILFDGYVAACNELTQTGGPFYVGDGVQARDTQDVASGEHQPGTVLSDNTDGTYDVQWESGGAPATLPAAQLRRLNRAVSRGTPRGVADLLASNGDGPLIERAPPPRHAALSSSLLQRRDQLVRSLLPALLVAHQRKSSMHQKFLSVLIATLEKANCSEPAQPGPPTGGKAQQASVTVEALTADLELLDARTVVGHGTTFGTVIVNPGAPKLEGRWYYEVKIGGSSYGQIGFAMNNFIVDTGSGDGVGDNAFSWAYDGWRQKIWNSALPEGHNEYGTEVRWAAGSVVGCLLDLEEGQISFALNGEPLGVAFTNVHSQLMLAREAGLEGICPAATFTAGRHELRFSEAECEHAPPGYHLYARPPNAFSVLDQLVEGCDEVAVPPEPAVDGESPQVQAFEIVRAVDAQAENDGVICAKYPLCSLGHAGDGPSIAEAGYFEVTVVAAGDGEVETDVTVGLANKTREQSSSLGCNMESIGYAGTATLLWDGAGAEQLLPDGAEHSPLPSFTAGDVIGCGIVAAPPPADGEAADAVAGGMPSFVRVFWTKNGELVCITADIIPALDEWYPAISLSRAGQRIAGHFSAVAFKFDVLNFLTQEFSEPQSEVAAAPIEDTGFVPQLMRTTREMLQSDSLASLLMALRLVTVALQWEVQSYALLRRQDVVRRVHALACGEMPRAIQSQPRPNLVVRQHAAHVLSVIDHVADGEPPEAQLDYFCGLADRIRAAKSSLTAYSTILDAAGRADSNEAGEATGIAAVQELAIVMDNSDGITEFEFEQADLAGALLEFINAPGGVGELRRLFAHDAPKGDGSAVGPGHFCKLIQMLQGVVACTDTLPVYHVPSDMRGAGSGMSCLLNPLHVAFIPDDASPTNSAPVGMSGVMQTGGTRGREMVAMFEPITPIVELEAFIRRSVMCTEPRFVQYCHDLVGCRLEERADGLDGWRGAHVVEFDEAAGRHTLLYENGNGDAPLVWRLLSSRTYRIQRGRCVSSQALIAAERELRTREMDDAKKLAKKKKSSGFFEKWGRKTSASAEPQWVPPRGTRVAVRSRVTKVWEPAVVLSSESDRIEVICDHASQPESVSIDQVLQLESPAPGDVPEVQWQWFDSQWWSFTLKESQRLEMARADPVQTQTEVSVHGTRYMVDFRSMTQRNTATGEERPVRRNATYDLWRELAPEGERAESDRQELSNIVTSPSLDNLTGGGEGGEGGDGGAAAGGSADALDVPSRLALTVRCGFGGFSMPGKAGQLVGHRQATESHKHAKMDDLPGGMTMFQCLMKATDMLDILSEDGQRSSSRTLVPWQCSFSIAYRLEVIDTATGLPLIPELQADTAPSQDAAAQDAATTQVVVVFENQRCPWAPFGDPKPDKFSVASLLRNDRHAWSDAAGAALPSPETDPLPPNGWAWKGAWYEASEWEYAYDWDSDWSMGDPGPKSWVRRRHWERELVDLSAAAPEPEPAPIQTTPPIQPVQTPAESQPIPSVAGPAAAGGNVELVRNLQQQASSPFITRWGLGGSPDAVASRLGDKRVAQAMRDLQGDSFVLDGPMSPPRDVDAISRPTTADSFESDDGDIDDAVPLPPAVARPPKPMGRVFSRLTALQDLPSEAEREKDIEDLRWEQALRGSPQAFRDSLRLMAHLHRDTVLRSYAGPDDWLSAKLGYKLRDQLSDPLTLVSGALPDWCECLMFGARFLYPFDLRQLFFRCTAFGPARAVAWLKLQQPRAFDPVGALKVRSQSLPFAFWSLVLTFWTHIRSYWWQVDRWLIKRENFLEQAYTLMSHHAKRKTALQVEFEGESGIGSGVHVSFFTDAASLLESWKENANLAGECGMPMWMTDSEARGSGESASDELMCELYPHSLLGVPSTGDGYAPAEAICRRFQLLGWLFAKALLDQQMDERLLPLRLSPLFLDLVLGRLSLQVKDPQLPESDDTGVAEIANLEELPFVELASVLIKGGTQIKMLHKLWLQYEYGELSEEDVDSTLLDYDVPFVDPATGGIPVAGSSSGALYGESASPFFLTASQSRLCVCLLLTVCAAARSYCVCAQRRWSSATRVQIGCCGRQPCANTSHVSGTLGLERCVFCLLVASAFDM